MRWKVACESLLKPTSIARAPTRAWPVISPTVQASTKGDVPSC